MRGRKSANTDLDDMFAVSTVEETAEETTFETPIDTKDSIALISEGIDNLESNAKKTVTSSKSLPKDYVVKVKSLVFGELIFKSKSNNTILSWKDIGEVREMTMEQLIDMDNANTDYLRKPYVVLLDPDAANYFGLSETYQNLAAVWNLQKLFELPINAIERTIDVALNVNLRDAIIAQVRKLYDNHILTDIRIIQLLERKLSIDIIGDNN